MVHEVAKRDVKVLGHPRVEREVVVRVLFVDGVGGEAEVQPDRVRIPGVPRVPFDVVEVQLHGGLAVAGPREGARAGVVVLPQLEAALGTLLRRLVRARVGRLARLEQRGPLGPAAGPGDAGSVAIKTHGGVGSGRRPSRQEF